MGNRNIHPHAEARLAMSLWADEYATQRGGCMDFWDSLPPRRKRFCADLLNDILASLENNGRAALNEESGGP